MTEQRFVDLDLPEFAFLDGWGREGEKLRGRNVILHVRSALTFSSKSSTTSTIGAWSSIMSQCCITPPRLMQGLTAKRWLNRSSPLLAIGTPTTWNGRIKTLRKRGCNHLFSFFFTSHATVMAAAAISTASVNLRQRPSYQRSLYLYSDTFLSTT